MAVGEGARSMLGDTARAFRKICDLFVSAHLLLLNILMTARDVRRLGISVEDGLKHMLGLLPQRDAKSTYVARFMRMLEEPQVRAHEQIADFTECPRMCRRASNGRLRDSIF